MNNPTSKSLPVLPLLALVVLLLVSGSIWRLWVARSAALVAEANWMACRELAEQIVPSGSTRQHNEPLEQLVEQAAETTQTEDHLSYLRYSGISKRRISRCNPCC